MARGSESSPRHWYRSPSTRLQGVRPPVHFSLMISGDTGVRSKIVRLIIAATTIWQFGVCQIFPNSRRLVLDYIEAVCNQIFILQKCSGSIRFATFCTAQLQKYLSIRSASGSAPSRPFLRRFQEPREFSYELHVPPLNHMEIPTGPDIE